MLDLDAFKTKLFPLGVFSEPFNFNGLFEELCSSEPDRAQTNLGILLEAMRDLWPVPAADAPESVPPEHTAAAASAPAPTSAAVAAPGGADDDWEVEDDEFEEDFEEQGTPDAYDSQEAVLQDRTNLPEAHKVSEDDDMGADEIDYEDEDFENDFEDEDASPKKAEPSGSALRPAAPTVHAKPPAQAPPAPVAAVTQPEDKDDYDEGFEDDYDEGFEEPDNPEEPNDDVSAYGSIMDQVDDNEADPRAVDDYEDDPDIISDGDDFEEDDDSIKSAED